MTIDRIQLAARLDHNYRYQRHVYDLTRKYYLLGRDRLIEGLNPSPGDSILEIGCGTGRNLIAAYSMYPDAHFYGLDLSRAMLDTARGKIGAAGLGKAVRLAEGDAADFDPQVLFGRPTFDRVVLSFALSMIPPWERALDQAAACLAPGGEIHIVDFGTGHALPRWAHAGLLRWLERFHVTPRDGLLPRLAVLAAQHDLHLSASEPYRSYSVMAVLGGAARQGDVR